LNLTWQVEAHCMLFMDETELKVNMHSNERVNLNPSQNQSSYRSIWHVNRVGSMYVFE
jgi:hypothetical protein